MASAKLLSLARQSGQLDLGNRNLTEVPANVCQINEKREEDEKWWEVSKLKRLFLQSNKIQNLPPGFEQLGDGLELLDVSDNQISEFMQPQQILKFITLKELRLNKNKLTNLNGLIFSLPSLATLHANENQITSLPDLTFLKSNNPSQTSTQSNSGSIQDKNLPEYMKGMNKYSHHYDHISFSQMDKDGQNSNGDNDLQSGVNPSPIVELHTLRILNLSQNKLTSIPGSICKCILLEEINLSKNLISELPNELFSNMRNLRSFNVNENRLSQIPPLIEKQQQQSSQQQGRTNSINSNMNHNPFPNLTELFISQNRITSLPEGICEVVSLVGIHARENKHLDLTSNGIKDIPAKLGLLNKEKMKFLGLDGNPVKSFRQGILQQGTQAVIEYLRTRLREEDIDIVAEEMQQIQSQQQSSSSQNQSKSKLQQKQQQSSSSSSSSSTNISPSSSFAFAAIPAAAGRQQRTQDLIDTIRESFSSQQLSLESKQLTFIPDLVVDASQRIKILNLSKNQLNEFIIGKYTGTQTGQQQGSNSRLSQSNINQQSQSSSQTQTQLFPFSQFAVLHTIDISQNNFTTLPDEFAELPSIKTIIAVRNRLKTLPESV
ncbi:MAG: putative leucine-rich repeat protein [Streblomastix strix]|uniref:Putative leucine-rich repeat protein n=1 Tax=Streblomastix strix TaxID=222440 RepID=A0A5J4WR02_9EUKA|nr:MAG: putative leucine-rich repeat protein [Streblomastix strix]